MTACVHGGHEFPEEDQEGAYCVEHGVTLLFRGDPITPDDLDQDAVLESHVRTCAVCIAGRACEVGGDLRGAAAVAALTDLAAPPVPTVPGCKTLHVVDEDGAIHELARVEVGRCSWCRLQATGLVTVGILQVGDGWTISACDWCARLHNLLPLDEHPPGSRHLPLRRDGTDADIPPAAP
ncbi:hypothetical protein [Streptomyces niveus]|uniref:hypothetical protein n=1 Tax=Streptomyces niveus TaxID=193462 RepID=UPI0036C19408